MITPFWAKLAHAMHNNAAISNDSMLVESNLIAENPKNQTFTVPSPASLRDWM
jgi:hypothetical protein